MILKCTKIKMQTSVGIFLISSSILSSALLNEEKIKIFGILMFISRQHFMLSLVEHGNDFITNCLNWVDVLAEYFLFFFLHIFGSCQERRSCKVLMANKIFSNMEDSDNWADSHNWINFHKWDDFFYEISNLMSHSFVSAAWCHIKTTVNKG